MSFKMLHNTLGILEVDDEAIEEYRQQMRDFFSHITVNLNIALMKALEDCEAVEGSTELFRSKRWIFLIVRHQVLRVKYLPYLTPHAVERFRWRVKSRMEISRIEAILAGDILRGQWNVSTRCQELWTQKYHYILSPNGAAVWTVVSPTKY